jgi:hypothetical protein
MEIGAASKRFNRLSMPDVWRVAVKNISLLALLAGVLVVASGSRESLAALRPLLPGEQIVYQTLQGPYNETTNPNYRVSFSQITGNAYTELGDEIRLGAGTTSTRFLTNVAIGTQTFKNPDTLEYQPAFLELSIYQNDGPPDPSGDSFIDAAPHDNPRPGTLIARTRISGPRYPAGGVGRSDANVDDFVINFPFNNIALPEQFSFALVNLDSNGNPDVTYGVNPPPNPNGWQAPSQRFGLWHSRGSTTNTIPGSGGPDYNNTGFNLNTVGTSRTGAPPYTLTSSGHWTWTEYNGLWESRRDNNEVVDATIYASNVPEPGVFAVSAMAATLLRRRRPARAR